MNYNSDYLLALYNASGGARARLSRFVLKHGPALEEGTPSFTVRSSHWAQARAQARALAALGITPVPGWVLADTFGESAAVPGVLFVRGEVSAVLESGVGVVGARRAEASLPWVYSLSREVAEAGRVVVSGGARGVDAAAHLGALAGGGRTVAYLGVASDRLYPAENRPLFRRILEAGGAVVSEHPPGVSTAPYHHASRNRFIAMQARHLVIAEAGVKSGTLGTVKWGLRLQVPLWVPPASVGGERSGLGPLLEAGKGRVLEDPKEVFFG